MLPWKERACHPRYARHTSTSAKAIKKCDMSIQNVPSLTPVRTERAADDDEDTSSPVNQYPPCSEHAHQSNAWLDLMHESADDE